MLVLLWLLPAVLVTAVAMAWVGWLGRRARREVDRDASLRRMARALEPRRRRWPGATRRRTP
ncbi:hypothetical protein [Nocardioides sp.]|uniref:hypothetical protein n=1 Tax=Nocardioides sp. TaxID=35761 RepID=UPI003512959B